MAIVGAKEVESGKNSLRTRSEGDKGAVALDDLMELLRKESVPVGFGSAGAHVEQKA
jgi:threonyl-tRNA synthetase